MEIPRECGCGCGTPINEKSVTAVALRRSGLTVAQTAQRMGINYGHVKMLCRQISRYAIGHHAKARGLWITRHCRFCDRTFKIPADSARTRCRNCPELSLAQQTELDCTEFDARERAKNPASRNHPTHCPGSSSGTRPGLRTIR